MKNIMRLFVITIALLMTSNMFGQQISIKGGLNFANMISKYEDDKSERKIKPGIHLGATSEFAFSDLISFEPGLLLSTKGYTKKEGAYKFSANLIYLDIPLAAKATFDLGSIKMYAKLGPYLGLGLSGKAKYKYDGLSESEKIKFGSDKEESNLKRLDYGLTTGAGVIINSLQIGLDYGLGLANLAPGGGDYKINNRVLGISVGYRLGGN